MEPKAKDGTGEKKVTETVCAKSAKEEIKGKSKEKGCHDGAEADAREVDGPVGGGEHESSQDSRAFPMEELAAEEVDAEHRKGTKENRSKF